APERPHAQLGRKAVLQEEGDGRVDGIALLRLVAHDGDDEDRRRRRVPREGVEQLPGRGGRAVRVVEDEDERTLVRDRLEKAEEGLEGREARWRLRHLRMERGRNAG